MTTTLTNYKTDWQDWHSARERTLATPHGWLSLTSFHWLPETPTALPGLPGKFSATDGRAVLEASATDGYHLAGGDPALAVGLDGRVEAVVAEAKSLDWLTLGDVVVELALRGGRYAIRTRDPQAAALRLFRGVPTFALDEDWILDGTFIPFESPQPIEVSTARTDLVQHITGVGTVILEIGGAQYSLVATAGAGGTLSIAFHDETNGDQTAPWRAVGTDVPNADGRVRIDFNRAINFPFAFSDYGTCPAPPAGNTVGVPVTAGERAPAAVA